MRKHRVYRVKIVNQQQEDNFKTLKNDEIDYWRLPSLKYGVSGLAMVPPSHHTWFEEALQNLNVDIDMHIEDVYKFLAEKESSADASHDNVRHGRSFDLRNYYRYDDITSYLYELEELYQNSTSISFEVVVHANTFEDRPLLYVKIDSLNPSDVAKPIVILEAGIVPRDWITISSAVNIINKLVGDEQRRYLDNYQWIIIPVLNPDGYEYTHTNDRLWMKSRRRRSILDVFCRGVHLNRNFDIDWQVSNTSSLICNDFFAGSSEFSEVESQMIQSLVEEHGTRIQLYLSLQNGGGYISYPWNYERAASGLFREHHLVGLKIVEAIGDEYKLGVASVNLGRASGTSVDYVRSKSIKYTYNIDIVQASDDGFLIPEEDIENISESVWRAVTTAVDNIQ
ncbi:carboxypeptidase B-like [Aphomia sociella]